MSRDFIFKMSSDQKIKQFVCPLKPLPGPTAQKRSRGRPKKGEESLSWNENDDEKLLNIR